MLCFLKSVATESLGDFGISLTIGLTRHRQIHAHLATFAIEVRIEIFYHLFACAFGYSYFVLCHEIKLGGSIQFFKLALRSTAKRTFLRCLISFMYVATYYAYKLLVHNLVNV